MAQTTSVSVIVPVYNHAALLQRSLEALAAQTKMPDEIIVIDDASSDCSHEVAKEFAARLSSCARYKVLRNDTNLGVNRTLNRGLTIAAGEQSRRHEGEPEAPHLGSRSIRIVIGCVFMIRTTAAFAFAM